MQILRRNKKKTVKLFISNPAIKLSKYKSKTKKTKKRKRKMKYTL